MTVCRRPGFESPLVRQPVTYVSSRSHRLPLPLETTEKRLWNTWFCSKDVLKRAEVFQDRTSSHSFVLGLDGTHGSQVPCGETAHGSPGGPLQFDRLETALAARFP
jgi:hypothetical protein